MKVNLRMLTGNWSSGYALDKHLISSTYLGVNEYGRDQFDNQRTEVGEATYQLKYRQDWSQAAPLAKAIFDNIFPKLSSVDILIPMAASTSRPRQPVLEVTNELGKLVVGDELILHSVFGAINYFGEGLFIAGGAGVTPFIAIFRQLKRQDILGNNTLLFGEWGKVNRN